MSETAEAMIDEITCTLCDRIAPYVCTTCFNDYCKTHAGHGEGHAK